MTPNSRRPLISDAVRSVIEAIEGDARAQGWPAELLWNTEPWGSPRGRASMLDEKDSHEGDRHCIDCNKEGLERWLNNFVIA
jgi:hypothetical protein